MVDAMRLPSGNARCAQERRKSARRGWANTHRQTRASFVGRPPTVCVRIVVAIAFKATTGGLRPPLLRCSANVSLKPAMQTIFACTNVRPGAAGVSPPWCASHLRHRKLPTVGLSRPLLTQQRSPIAKKTFSNTHAFLYQERRASARRGALPIRDIGSCHPETNELLGEPTPGGRSNDSVDRAGRSILSAVRRRWHRRTCRTSKTGAEKVPTANTQENL
jgi:hypothetical protein